MINFPIHLPYLDPVMIKIAGFEIRYYSIAYIIGILAANFLIKEANQKEKFLSPKAYDEWMIWAVLSILIGGRLGYILFYGTNYFDHPLEIFMIWHGGMSFHGGLAGIIFGMWLFCKKYQIKFFKLSDVLAMATPIGLFLGRIANFVNMELYGRITNSNYGFIFPNAGPLPRHPSQLYEAFFEGIVIFIILFCLNKYSKLAKNTGFLSGAFLILYGSFRIIFENFREPDEQLGFLLNYFTMGQLLSMPLIIAGILIVKKSIKK
jgi:phosphatidylglycerol:prolipoprotein diacylglycerol transferase